jgi:hypothetical protein
MCDNVQTPNEIWTINLTEQLLLNDDSISSWFGPLKYNNKLIHRTYGINVGDALHNIYD